MQAIASRAIRLDQVSVQPDAAAPDAPVEQTGAWLLHPVIDYLLACGGLVWILFAIHFFFLSGSGKGAATALITLSATGALFLGEGHTAATLVRTYGRKELRDRLGFYTRWLAAFLLFVGALGTTVPGVAPVLVKIYLLMVPHHLMAQSYGIARMYCLKHNYRLNVTEKVALQAVTFSTVLFATLKQLTYRQWSGTSFLGQAIPFWGPLPEPFLLFAQSLLIASMILFAAVIIHRATRTEQFFPLPALLTMITGVAAFTMGPAATGIYWLYVSAFFHATQYLLVIVTCHLKECAYPSSPRQRLASLAKNSPATRLLGMVLLVSVFIYVGIPGILAQFGFNYSWAVAAIFTVVNFQHILLDGVLWRLRRPELRRSLEV